MFRNSEVENKVEFFRLIHELDKLHTGSCNELYDSIGPFSCFESFNAFLAAKVNNGISPNTKLLNQLITAAIPFGLQYVYALYAYGQKKQVFDADTFAIVMYAETLQSPVQYDRIKYLESQAKFYGKTNENVRTISGLKENSFFQLRMSARLNQRFPSLKA